MPFGHTARRPRYCIRAGIILGAPPHDLSSQSSICMGAEISGGYYIVVSNMKFLWTHEFDFYKGDIFTFSGRAGIGYT